MCSCTVRTNVLCMRILKLVIARTVLKNISCGTVNKWTMICRIARQGSSGKWWYLYEVHCWSSGCQPQAFVTALQSMSPIKCCEMWSSIPHYDYLFETIISHITHFLILQYRQFRLWNKHCSVEHIPLQRRGHEHLHHEGGTFLWESAMWQVWFSELILLPDFVPQTAYLFTFNDIHIFWHIQLCTNAILYTITQLPYRTHRNILLWMQ